MSDIKIPEVPDVPPPADSKDDKTSKEVGGSNKPEPTRYGDWEVGGICTDF